MSNLTDPRGIPLAPEIDPSFLASLAFELFVKHVHLYDDVKNVEADAWHALNVAKIFIETNAKYRP